MVSSPLLIQRAKIVKPLADKKATLSNSVRFDYMGSAEFEFGALPSSLRHLKANRDDLAIRMLYDVKEGESSLRVLSVMDEIDFGHYSEYLRELRFEDPPLKEVSYFSIKPKYFLEKEKQADFWWDIVNHVMWSFDKNYMNRLIGHLHASFDAMSS